MSGPKAFFERHPVMPLERRAAAEAIGTFLLVFTVVTAARDTQGFGTGDAAIARALAVGPTLIALILAFGPVSGGHFNPLITLAQWLRRERPTTCLVAYLTAQVAGAATGAIAATALFSNPEVAARMSISPAAILAFELIASFGLLTLVLAAPRMEPAGAGPFAVGGWIAMTLAGLPTAPAANPAITIGLLFPGPASFGLITSALAQVGMQIGGLGVALATLYFVSPRPIGMAVSNENSRRLADDNG